MGILHRTTCWPMLENITTCVIQVTTPCSLGAEWLEKLPGGRVLNRNCPINTSILVLIAKPNPSTLIQRTHSEDQPIFAATVLWSNSDLLDGTPLRVKILEFKMCWVFVVVFFFYELVTITACSVFWGCDNMVQIGKASCYIIFGD